MANRVGISGSDSSFSSTRSSFARSFRFIVIGLVNLVLTYALYLARGLFLSYPAAYTISYACGILISYLLNSRFVFKSPIRISKAAQYPIVYLAQYLLGMALLYLLVE